MKCTRAAAWLTVCLALTVACSEGSPEPRAQRPATDAPEIDDVTAALQERVSDYDDVAPGVIALVRVGDEVQVVTRGRADVERRVPMRADQTFPIGSITKPMTATIVMQLVAEGRIALDDDVRQWLPELDSLTSPITIEQVLSHRSGLLRDPGTRDVRQVGLADTTGLVERAARHGLEFEPGTRGQYSNLGYGALGLLVERVLHQPLGKALDLRVFRAAGMSSSALAVRPEVRGYDENDEPITDYDFGYVPGAGSVVSTVGDVDTFFRALWSGQLLDQADVAEMRRSRGRVQVSPDLSVDYGLGLTHERVTCGDTIGHGGRIGGFTSEAWTLEGTDRSVVVFVNYRGADFVSSGIVETALCA